MKKKIHFDYSPSIYSGQNGQGAQSLPCTREIFEDQIKSDHVKDIYDRCRQSMQDVNESTPKEEFDKVKHKVNKLKAKLPVIMPGAHSLTGKRKVTGPADYVRSPFITLDIDNVDDPKALWNEKIAPHIKQLHIALAFITPSTKGVKVIALCPSNLDMEHAMAWLANELGIEEYDKCVKDPLRAHFMPHESSILYYDSDSLFDPNLTNEGYVVETAESEPQPQQPNPKPVAVAQVVETNDVEAMLKAGYCGIPYEEIVKTYIEEIWGEKEPEIGDRNTKSFEIANQLRYICDNNAELLDRIIPCFSDLPQNEKQQAIRSAVSYPIKMMPSKMQSVLQQVKRRHVDQPDILNALDEAEDQQYRLPAEMLILCFRQKAAELPKSILASFDGVNPNLRMAVLVGICPFIGGIATGVTLKIHDDYSHLNLYSFIVGEAASGKSKLETLYKIWLHHIIEQDNKYLAIEKEWFDLPKKKREATQRPKNPLRRQPLRCSTADVLLRMKNADQKHLLSFASEADQLTDSQKSGAYANVSVLIREAYDGAEFNSSYAGSDAVNAHIKEVLWNIVLCSTPDGLRRAFRNVTDGALTRVAIATTPDNTFMPLLRVESRTEESIGIIQRVAFLLDLLKGSVELPELEETNNKWLEKIRIETLKDDDKVRARQRMRIAVTTSRMICCLMLCEYVEWLDSQFANVRQEDAPQWMQGAASAEDFLTHHPEALAEQLPSFQKPAYLAAFDVIADYLLENTLVYFGNKLIKSYESEDYVVDDTNRRKGKNKIIFDRLNKRFSIDDIRAVKTDNCKPESRWYIVGYRISSVRV